MYVSVLSLLLLFLSALGICATIVVHSRDYKEVGMSHKITYVPIFQMMMGQY